MIDCICGSRMAKENLEKHLKQHTKDELADMLYLWLISESMLEETFPMGVRT